MTGQQLTYTAGESFEWSKDTGGGVVEQPSIIVKSSLKLSDPSSRDSPYRHSNLGGNNNNTNSEQNEPDSANGLGQRLTSGLGGQKTLKKRSSSSGELPSMERSSGLGESPITAPTNHTSPLLDHSYSSSTSFNGSTGLRPNGGGTIKRRQLQGGTSSSSNNSPTNEDDKVDIESQSKIHKAKFSLFSRKRSAESSGTTTTPSIISQQRSATSIHVKIILKKIIHAVLTDLDDETLRREDTESILIIITLLKEAMLGVVIAFALVSFILFLDHRFLLGLPTARNFRKATFAVMNDKETLYNFEENTGMKFVDMEEYESMMSEINQAENKTKLADAILKTREEDLILLRKDLSQYDGVLPGQFKTTGLDKWCDSCVWGMKMTCLNRALSLEDRYNSPKFESMMSTMKDGKCRMNEQQIKEDEEKRVKMNELLKDWKTNEKEFCFECEFDVPTNIQGWNCNQRAQYLNYRLGYKIDEAKARTMVDTEICTYAYQLKENELLARLNEDGVWGNNMSCRKRVDYLTYTYKDSERKATLAAMKKPECVLGVGDLDILP